MEKLFGLIFMKKRIQIKTNLWKDIYKVIGYGECKEDNSTNALYFCTGDFSSKLIRHISEAIGSKEICSALLNTENTNHEDLIKYYDSIKNKYYIIEKNGSYYMDMTEIEDKNLIAKCRIAFGDDLIGIETSSDILITDELENQPIQDNPNNEKHESLFLSYDIEGKYKLLKEHVFGQNEQLKQLLSCIIKNINLVDNSLPKEMVAKLKSNILLLGKTGVGKTLMIKEIAKLFNIPYVIEDATRYSGTGWSGEDVENMIRNLYVASNNDLEKAQSGILVVDEFDKLCQNNSKSEHSTITVQQSLLKLVEGTKINISRTNHTNIGGFEFDTSKLTIIFAGAFDGIDKIIEKRTEERKAGFSAIQTEEKDKSIQIEDLIEYGVISEFAGRMSNIIELNNPSKNDLKNAFLYSKSSTLNLLDSYLKINGVKIEFDEEFVDAVVDKAITLKTGYRGLNQTLNNVVEKEMFDIISGKNKVLSLTSEKVK